MRRGRLDQSLSEHLAVFAALKARDSEGADAAMRTHMTRQREALREVAQPSEIQGDAVTIPLKNESPDECDRMVPARGCVLAKIKVPVAPEAAAKSAPKSAQPSARSTAERLQAHSAQGRRSPVAARAAPRAGRPAGRDRPARERGRGWPPRPAIADAYRAATAEERRDYWALMSEHFAADAQKLKTARDQHQAAVGTPTKARPSCACAARWCRRACACCSALRSSLKACASWSTCAPTCFRALKADKRLLALDAELGTSSPPGSTWRSSNCAASTGIRPPR